MEKLFKLYLSVELRRPVEVKLREEEDDVSVTSPMSLSTLLRRRILEQVAAALVFAEWTPKLDEDDDSSEK